MALFKIQKGPAANLGASGNPTEIAQEGFAYFTPDDGKFYIDIENANEAVIGENRIPINAYLADKFSSDKLITLTGDVTGTDAKDGETGWSIATTLRNSGVISGLYGPEGNEVTNGAVIIPRLTINEKGLITRAESVEVSISGITDNLISQLNVNEKTFANGEVLKTLKEENGKISFTTGQLSIDGGILAGSYVINLKEDNSSFSQFSIGQMQGATATTPGAIGLVPAPQIGDNTKVLSGAGTWIEQSSYSLPLASSSTRGGIKIGFESNPNTKNYALLLNDEKAYVNVPWTDRSVEGPGYHYIPQEDSASILSISATGGTAEWGIDVVQGVKIRRDNRGHITGLEVISGKIPDQPTYPNNRDPGYGSITIDTASTEINVPIEKKNTATITAVTYSERLTLSPTNKWIVMGAADNSSTGLDKVYIGHNISTVTKGSYGPSADVNVTNGGNFKVPYVSVDEAGHITGASTKTITLPTTSDTKVTQYNFTQNSDLRVILSNSATGNEETATVNKSNNLTYNPSTNILNTGNLVLSDDLSVGGDVDITGALDVTGDVTFIKTPNAPTAAAGSNDTKLATTAFVTSAINGLVGPMRFIGTLGTGGTATALASASASNKGYTYKVITEGTYLDVTVKVGDLVISNGSSWVVVPSGDEPSGTVTNIATGDGLTGGPITSTGTISHADTSTQASILAADNKYISGIILDDFGHITELTAKTEFNWSNIIDKPTIIYTPEGVNEKSEVTISPITTNIYSMTSAGSVTAGTTPTLTMSVNDSTETLSFTWDAGTSTAVTLPERSSAIAAWTGYTTGIDNTYAEAQEFIGTQATITI